MTYEFLEALNKRNFKFVLPAKAKPPEEAPAAPKHEHAWQYYKKTLGVDGKARLHTLIFRGCPDCQVKHAIDLKVS